MSAIKKYFNSTCTATLLLLFLSKAITTSHAFVVPHHQHSRVTFSSCKSNNPSRFSGAYENVYGLLQTNNKFHSTALFAEKKNKGVYSRPSAAIERGSGFFIPGLEGERVRLLFGLLVLILTVANHMMSPGTTAGVAFSESLAVLYAILLLLQAAIEFGKEQRGYVVSLDRPEDEGTTGSKKSDTLSQVWTIQSPTKYKDVVQWSAASYIALTPASHIFLLESDKGVVYRLGSTKIEYSENDENVGTNAALETVNKSKGGRVSLPSTHPAVTSLVNEKHGRCVVLQSINENQCWMMTSNQLLQSFTKEDLKWLGQLATYVKNTRKE
mmetsp:Transcript_18532/g.26177  ORF Transcript_18532/g.26177 Transcript_18532/m.26177 type:complete len:326 (+) Transcript_18532:133-1110(+)